MRKKTALLCVGLAGMATIVGGVGQASAASTDQAERALVEKINRVRATHGLRKLAISPSLARSAARWSWSQMAREAFGHAPRIQASPRYRTLGEILAMHVGRRPHVGFTVDGWLSSPPHTHVMLEPGFRVVGAGRAVGRFGGGGRTTIWTVQFGA
jgi:uncharacterized protein YkwD